MLGTARTKKEQTRIDIIHEAGCVACMLEAKLQGRKYRPEPGDVHHVDQDDHSATYCSCPWHHRSVCKFGFTESRMREVYGPSMAKEPERYRARYGAESDMLGYQQRMIDDYCKKWQKI